jgi:hypothetical protein
VGTDIHDYAEIFHDGRWQYAGDNAFPTNEWDIERHSPFGAEREYNLFAFLAGVRNDRDIKPLAEPRGLPADISAETHARICENADYGYSWFTLAELLAVDYEQLVGNAHRRFFPLFTARLRNLRKASPVEPDTGETLRQFLGEWYFDRLHLIGALGNPRDVRVVFGFDS